MAGKKKTNDKKKSSWLSTNDWLGEKPPATTTPAPATNLDAGQTTDSMPIPEGALGGETVTGVPGSLLPIGGERGQLSKVKPSDTPSSVIIAKADLAEMTAAMSRDDEDDDAIDLATPPGGATTGPPSLSKILKATGTKSDIIRGGKPETSDALGYTPTGPGSGWLASRTLPKSGGSRVDIGNLPRPTEDQSDIFSGARADATGGTGSNLLPGMSGIGRSSVFSDSRAGSSGIGAGAESDLFAGLSGVERGSSVYDDSSKKTQRVSPKFDEGDIFRNAPPPGDDASDMVPLLGDDFDGDGPEIDARPLASGPPSSARLADRLLAGLADSGGYARPDFNTLDKTQSGSNLFDDVTAMDIDLGSDAGASGTSGLNWLDPNRSGAQDSGPGSSIFHKMPAGESSDPGRVDLSQIPMIGSTDDEKDMVQNSDLAGPASSVLRKELQKAMRELKAEGGVSFDIPEGDAEDGAIAWGTPHATIDQQVSMRMPVSDDELDLAAPPSGSIVGLTRKKGKSESDSVFDDVIEQPDESGILVRDAAPSASMSGSILQGMTGERLSYRNAASQVAAPTRIKSPSTRELDLDEKTSPSGKSKRGLLIGALGLALGVGAGAAGMYFANPSIDKSNSAKVDGAQGAVSLADAYVILNAGDPAAAREAFRKVKDDSPEARAGRGQAIWMARARDAASKNEKLVSTDNDLNFARADLQSVLDRSAGLTTPEDQRAGLRAALNLGLIHEATGNPAKAIDVYRGASNKLPAYKKVFESATRRVTIMMKRIDGTTNNQYTLAPEVLWDLADANRILLDFDSVQAIDDEPGFHFWEAVGFATDSLGKDSFDKALASITKARDAHAARRQKLLGMGLNPVSDPTEQMFLRTCDELKTYWTMKRRIYTDPVGLAIAKGDATNKGKSTDGILIELLDAKRAAKSLPVELAAATKKANDAIKAKETADLVSKSLQKDRDDLTKQVENLNKNITLAKTAATAAGERVKAAEAALDPVIAKLKAAKLIDERATREEALAALPKLTLGTGSNAEMAKELTALKDKLDVETADAKKKIAALEVAAKDVDAKVKIEVEKAVAAAKKESEDKITAAANEARVATARAEEERRRGEKKAVELREAYEQQIAAARSGAVVAMTDLERSKLDDANRAFVKGVDAYFANQFNDAEKLLAQSAEKHPNDARTWYFLGLAKFQQGRSQDAIADFKKGAIQEDQGRPQTDEISKLLINVQGAPRIALDAARP